MIVRAVGLVTCLALAIPVSASAQTPPPTDAAEATLRNGVELRRHGDDAGALQLFRAAYSQSHSPIALAQMGFAEQALGQWLQAEAHVRAALDADDPWIAQNRGDIERAYALIRQHVGTIEIIGGVPGATVALNGEIVGRLPLSEPIRALAGRGTLEVRATGYYPITREVSVVAGEPTRESVELRRVTSEGPPVDTSAGATQRTGALIAAVGGVLLLGGGIVALAVRESAVQSYNSDPQCPGIDSPVQPAPCGDRVSTAGYASTFAPIFLAVGGAAAALSIVLYVTAPSGSAHRATARLECTPGVGTVGVACGFRY